eukprot:scaffold477091_cov42-Prasinocladus_malaysianus.AAC.1
MDNDDGWQYIMTYSTTQAMSWRWENEAQDFSMTFASNCNRTHTISTYFPRKYTKVISSLD